MSGQKDKEQLKNEQGTGQNTESVVVSAAAGAFVGAALGPFGLLALLGIAALGSTPSSHPDDDANFFSSYPDC